MNRYVQQGFTAVIIKEAADQINALKKEAATRMTKNVMEMVGKVAKPGMSKKEVAQIVATEMKLKNPRIISSIMQKTELGTSTAKAISKSQNTKTISATGKYLLLSKQDTIKAKAVARGKVLNKRLSKDMAAIPNSKPPLAAAAEKTTSDAKKSLPKAKTKAQTLWANYKTPLALTGIGATGIGTIAYLNN